MDSTLRKAHDLSTRAAVAVGCLVLLLLAPAGARVVDRVVAVVNEEIILQSEVDALCAPALADLPATLPLDEAVKRKGEIRKEALDSLIENLLVRQQIREHKIIVADDEVNDEIKRVMELNKLSEQQLLEALKLHENKTLEQFKEDRRRDMEQQKLIDVQIRSNPELKGRLQVTEKDVEDAYQTQFLSVGSTEKIRASHILFSIPAGATPEQEAEIRAKAERVLAEIKAGGSFEELAKQHSEDPSSALGGDLGFFRHGDMVGPFDTAAFALKKGEVSELVRTQFGLHLIKVTDRAMEGPRPLAEVQNEVRARLQRERFQRVLQDWIEDLRRRSNVITRL
jgi:parvulin-like peptidyl-prolyl isomerase